MTILALLLGFLLGITAVAGAGVWAKAQLKNGR